MARRRTIRADKVVVGMVIETGGTARGHWKPGSILVDSIEYHPDYYPEGIIFKDDGKRRIYRWDENDVKVLKFPDGP